MQMTQVGVEGGCERITRPRDGSMLPRMFPVSGVAYGGVR
jgi:hypothetical protein